MASPAKKAKAPKQADSEWAELWADEAEADPAPAAKKAKKTKKAEEKLEGQDGAAAETPATDPADLEVGAVVLFWDGYRGVIRDAFVPLDEFWVCDEESGEVVRDDAGDIVHFKSSELQLVVGPPVAPPRKSNEGPPGGVFILGTEQQMMKILHHFGSPDTNERHQPQLLLALPCTQCHPDTILSLASQGVDADVRKLALAQRPDMNVAIRVFHLKHALQELGGDLLRMEDFYLMSSINIPYSWEEIEAAKGWQKKWRRDVCNQIDVGATARGLAHPGDAAPEDAARRTLGEECGVAVSLVLWDEEVQANIRQRLDIVDLPLKFTDVNDGRITVLLLPSDALVNVEDGILCFTESPGADYLAAEGGAPEADVSATEISPPAGGGARRAALPEDPPPAQMGPQGKTIASWEAEQAQFAHLPKIPPDWVRVISQKTGDVYFFNKKTQEATFERPEMPLPPGWTKQVSKSTGKSYYFHAARRKSQFERPTE